VQPEYVEVPDAVLASKAELKTCFAASYVYVGALKPRPTTKAKITLKPETSAKKKK
jgi:hypothetical protein